ncbi:hypothetical protein PR048_026530 [Dryococelus australis]|uniref:Uncharacterized protein n=1 Tax=Dryococelus australis TaxID=614101 RepID=A0ABQ9GLK1_9NEOP|nr:hypothetical protein PR048_026530 [Dryococelus australis]
MASGVVVSCLLLLAAARAERLAMLHCSRSSRSGKYLARQAGPCRATITHTHRPARAINGIRLERASQKQPSDIHKTPYDRVKRCRERKINITASERVNKDYPPSTYIYNHPSSSPFLDPPLEGRFAVVWRNRRKQLQDSGLATALVRKRSLASCGGYIGSDTDILGTGVLSNVEAGFVGEACATHYSWMCFCRLLEPATVPRRGEARRDEAWFQLLRSEAKRGGDSFDVDPVIRCARVWALISCPIGYDVLLEVAIGWTVGWEVYYEALIGELRSASAGPVKRALLPACGLELAEQVIATVQQAHPACRSAPVTCIKQSIVFCCIMRCSEAKQEMKVDQTLTSAPDCCSIKVSRRSADWCVDVPARAAPTSTQAGLLARTRCKQYALLNNGENTFTIRPSFGIHEMLHSEVVSCDSHFVQEILHYPAWRSITVQENEIVTRFQHRNSRTSPTYRWVVRELLKVNSGIKLRSVFSA